MIKLQTKFGHRINSLSIVWRFRLKPSVYQHPFLSARWLCFEFVHEWNPISPSKEEQGE